FVIKKHSKNGIFVVSLHLQLLFLHNTLLYSRIDNLSGFELNDKMTVSPVLVTGALKLLL
ncbi:MAG: hypothetical protein U0J62_07265, partial [Lachnospiraceae bacterium]|nr:hypothetical protein [Lachnospiraceae bacterium]